MSDDYPTARLPVQQAAQPRPLRKRRRWPVILTIVVIVLAVLLVASAALWSMGAAPSIEGVSVPGVLGYLVAVVLGIRLLRKIGRGTDDPEG